MKQRSHQDGLRIIDVPELGWEAALVDIDGVPCLLVDPDLSCDERMAVLAHVMQLRKAS